MYKVTAKENKKELEFELVKTGTQIITTFGNELVSIYEPEKTK